MISRWKLIVLIPSLEMHVLNSKLYLVIKRCKVYCLLPHFASRVQASKQ